MYRLFDQLPRDRQRELLIVWFKNYGTCEYTYNDEIRFNRLLFTDLEKVKTLVIILSLNNKGREVFVDYFKNNTDLFNALPSSLPKFWENNTLKDIEQTEQILKRQKRRIKHK